jgi:hypothetical protein
MLAFALSYLLVGLIFGWFWYFKDVRVGAQSGEYLFYLLLVFVWPLPLWTEVIANFRR